jgi:hypothetical protein
MNKDQQFRNATQAEVDQWMADLNIDKDKLDPITLHCAVRFALLTKSFEEASSKGTSPLPVSVYREDMYDTIVNLASERGFTVAEVESEPIADNMTKSYLILI